MYLAVIQNSSNCEYFCTMSNDGMLRLFQNDESGNFVEKANLAFGRNLQESICLSELGNTHLILLIGGYDSKIHVYTFRKNSSNLVYKFSMLGHFNSIKSIAVSPLLKDKVVYIASGSQDNNIRIWKM